MSEWHDHCQKKKQLNVVTKGGGFFCYHTECSIYKSCMLCFARAFGYRLLFDEILSAWYLRTVYSLLYKCQFRNTGSFCRYALHTFSAYNIIFAGLHNNKNLIENMKNFSSSDKISTIALNTNILILQRKKSKIILLFKEWMESILLLCICKLSTDRGHTE